jgi:hypothetical protein
MTIRFTPDFEMISTPPATCADLTPTFVSNADSPPEEAIVTPVPRRMRAAPIVLGGEEVHPVTHKDEKDERGSVIDVNSGDDPVTGFKRSFEGEGAEKRKKRARVAFA